MWSSGPPGAVPLMARTCTAVGGTSTRTPTRMGLWPRNGSRTLGYSRRAPLRLDPRRDRRDAARRHAAALPEPARPAVGQARGEQPDRLYEGPDRPRDGRGGRAVRRADARQDAPRADLGE